MLIFPDDEKIFNNPSGEIVNKAFSNYDLRFRLQPLLNKIDKRKLEAKIITDNIEMKSFSKYDKVRLLNKNLYFSHDEVLSLRHFIPELIRDNEELTNNHMFKEIFFL